MGRFGRFLTVGGLLVIAACGGGGDENATDGDSAPTGSESEAYSSASKLTAALEKAGVPCPKWVKDDDDLGYTDSNVSPVMVGAASSSSCQDPADPDVPRETLAVVAVFSSTSARDSGVTLIRDGGWSDPVAVGANWLYVGPDAELVAEKFDAEIVEPEFQVD